MSDAVDDVFLHIGDDECYEWDQYQIRTKREYSIRDNKDYWGTKDGKKLYPHQMDTGHIKNTIRMIEKNCVKKSLNPIDYKIYNLLVDELNKR